MSNQSGEMAELLQGTRLGKYELLECIGQGGMAVVYRANQCSAFGREVALKVMRPEYTGDGAFRQRFLREARAISRLSHPNILPLIEFGEENNTLYLVMPLVREGTLRDLLMQHAGPLSLEEALPLFVPLCDAVQYAHQEGIIHRDIKPQNILMQRRTHVLLADFGIARDRLDTRMTTTGVAVGSLEYMAPEQAEGRASAQSDIYSLGVVLYQMLTGVLPYVGTLPLEVLFKKASDPLPDPRWLNPRLPAELVEMLQLALAPDPRQRFETAEALSMALQQVRLAAKPLASPFQMNWPPVQAPPAPLAADLATTRRVARRPPPAQQGRSPAAATWADETTIPEEEWQQGGRWSRSHHGGNPLPDASRRSRPRYSLLLVALALLGLGITSIAYGSLSQGWLRPNASSPGARQVTPAPGVTMPPTALPGPMGTPPAQPASTATPQATAPPPSQPTATGAPPVETPTVQPTPDETPEPTETPTAQATLPATPARGMPTTPAPPTGTPPTQSAAPPPTSTQPPGASPGNAPAPDEQS